MNPGKPSVVSILWAFGGVMWLVPVVKDAVKGEPIRTVFLAMAVLFFLFAFVFRGGTRTATGDPTPPKL